MSEKKLMLSGNMYDPSDPELVRERHEARLLLQNYNRLGEDKKADRIAVLHKLLPNARPGLYIEPPFYCDYGYNIYMGEKVYLNFNCCILDVMSVNIGDRTMLAPGVQIYTATHPMQAIERNSGREFAKPVTIGNDVWIGGGSIICPGVSVGHGVVVGAGAVVTKDVPDNAFIAGNPARVVRMIDQNK